MLASKGRWEAFGRCDWKNIGFGFAAWIQFGWEVAFNVSLGPLFLLVEYRLKKMR